MCQKVCNKLLFHVLYNHSTEYPYSSSSTCHLHSVLVLGSIKLYQIAQKTFVGDSTLEMTDGVSTKMLTSINFNRSQPLSLSTWSFRPFQAQVCTDIVIGETETHLRQQSCPSVDYSIRVMIFAALSHRQNMIQILWRVEQCKCIIFIRYMCATYSLLYILTPSLHVFG